MSGVLIIVGDATETLTPCTRITLAGSWLHARRRWAGKTTLSNSPA